MNIMQKLNLDKPFVIFDLETTGVIVNLDKIVEISYLKIFPNGAENKKTYRINPGIKIPRESIAVHGITDEEAASHPYFKEYAQEIFDDFTGCYFGGFNVIGFDLDLLKKEFKEAGLNFNYNTEDVIDSKVIFHTMEKRDLSSAYKFYCQKEHTGAHGAEADVKAALEVLSAQIDSLLFERLQDISHPSSTIIRVTITASASTTDPTAALTRTLTSTASPFLQSQ